MNTPSTARTQWHPPFCTSLQIELRSDRENLEFQEEFQVRKLPGRVDTLIIMKDPSKPVHKSIGQIFVKYNLIEYKPPGDSLTIDDYFYMIGNASLLKSNSKSVDRILYSDVSITFVCYRHPRKLMRFLAQDLKRKVDKVSAGIYHMMKGSKGILPPMIPDCFAFHALAIFKTFVIRAFFYEKWLLTHVLAGPKFKNPLASKLAPDFRPFEPGIII